LQFDEEPNKKIKGEELDQSKVAPWVGPNTMKIKNPLAKLHNEIIDFYNYITPSNEEHNRRV